MTTAFIIRWICRVMLLLGLLLPVGVQAECAADTAAPLYAVAAVVETGPQMAASGTPFSTHRRDADLLVTALAARSGAGVPVLKYTSAASYAAALQTAAEQLSAQSAQRRTLALITAGLPPGATLPAPARTHTLLVIDLARDPQLAAAAERAAALYVPFHARHARDLPEQFAALERALAATGSVGHMEPSAPLGPACGSAQAVTEPQHAADPGVWRRPISVAGTAALLALAWFVGRRRPAIEPQADAVPITVRYAAPGAPDERPTAVAALAPVPDDRRAVRRLKRFDPGKRIITRRNAAAAPSLGRAERLRPGIRIGVYTILWKLGAGGQATSYLALGPGLRRVVLKTAHSGAEAALCAEHAWLSRSAAPHVHLRQTAPYPAQDTLGRASGSFGPRRAWIALAYAPGRPLSAWRRLQFEEAIQVTLQAAHALAHLHCVVGVVHQDVTPANLIVHRRWNGALHTTLIDLSAADELLLPRGRACYGVGPYIAPERFGNPPPPPDPQSDIFALGVVLRTLLAEQAVPPQVGDLIAAMTEPDLLRRRAALPTMADVIARLEGIAGTRTFRT